MTFEARLGGGLDGCVWKVRFGDQGPFALKVFWDTEPPAFAHYYAPQRECQNAALLQMMETAVKQAVASCRPILVNANPTTWEDALANLAAFSDEARHQPPPAQGGLDDLRPGLRQILAMPCIRKCYGWLTLKSKIFGRLPRKLMAPVLTVDKVTRFIAADKEYMAIVYEYVEEGENDPAAVQESLDFFWLAGFSGTLSQLAQNWKSGVLVDLSDIAPPRGYGWSGRLYQTGPGSALAMLKEGVLIRNPAQTGTRGCPHPALRALPTLQRSGAQASSPQLSHSHSQECDNATENSSTTAEHPEKPPGATSMELLTPRASHPIQNGQPVSTEPKADRTPSRTCKRKGIDGDEEVGKERRLGPPRAQQLPVPT